MSNFWTAEDKIPIGQTKIAVPAEHGLDYSPGQKIEFHIPSSVNFFQPKESYLKFDVKITNNSNPIFLQLDGQLGGQVLIRDLRIYSGGSGRVLLEEYQNYNVLTAVKYDYEINDTIKQKRSLTEGCVYYNQESRSTTGLVQDTANNVTNNPYFVEPTALRGATSNEVTFKKCKCLLPLNTGIFSNDKIFPVGLTDGLIVEIILEDAKHCIQALDTGGLLNRKLMGNPITLSAVETTDTAAPADPNNVPLYPIGSSVANGSAFSEFWIRRDNTQGINAAVGASLCPLAIGQRIGFVSRATLAENPSVLGTTYGTIDDLDYDAGTINAVRVSLNASYSPTVTMTQDMIVIDKSMETGGAAWAPTYEVTDCEFIVQQVQMPQGYTSKLTSMMKEGGAMNYDFLSFTNYKTSQIQSELVSTLRVPLVQTRAKSVLAVPVDAGVYTQLEIMEGTGTEIEYYDRQDYTAGGQNRSVRPGLVGISDNLTQYQLFYDGRLNPSRKVKCDRTSNKRSVDAQPIIELEKALVMAGIYPHSLLNFQKNFVIGRALSLQDGVYDTRGRDFQLQVEYQETAAPAHNKLWNVWCSHLRRIVIAGNSIQLQV